jgi:hypothetical protein
VDEHPEPGAHRAFKRAVGEAWPVSTRGDRQARAEEAGARLLKVVCGAYGHTVRFTQQWIDTGLPSCPCGMEWFQLLIEVGWPVATSVDTRFV